MNVRRPSVVRLADQQIDEPDHRGLVGQVTRVGELVIPGVRPGAELGVEVLHQLEHGAHAARPKHAPCQSTVTAPRGMRLLCRELRGWPRRRAAIRKACCTIRPSNVCSRVSTVAQMGPANWASRCARLYKWGPGYV